MDLAAVVATVVVLVFAFTGVLVGSADSPECWVAIPNSHNANGKRFSLAFFTPDSTNCRYYLGKSLTLTQPVETIESTINQD